MKKRYPYKAFIPQMNAFLTNEQKNNLKQTYSEKLSNWIVTAFRIFYETYPIARITCMQNWQHPV
jgi:hypothetical protein